MSWICLALCFSGFAALSLGTERHHGQVFVDKGNARKRRSLSVLGWLLLAGATAPSIIDLGPSVGLAMWAALLSIAAGVLMLLLTYTPRLIVPLAVAAPSLSMSLLLF